MFSSTLSQHLGSLGTSVPKMVSTLVQPWSQTAASNWSTLTPRVKLSLIRSNSSISASLSLHHPQRIKLSMAFRLLPEPLQGRCLPPLCPRQTQLPTFKISSNHDTCVRHRLSCPHISCCLPVQASHPKNPHG